MLFPAIQLAEFDLRRLRLVKQVVAQLDGYDHSRWIFYSPRGAGGQLADSYIKLWNPGHLRRDNLLRGIAAGFYDQQTVPALRGVVWHRGLCRGYVMARCAPSRRLDPAFYRLIRERTAQTGHFHPQFSRAHARRFQTSYSLIDLEGVYTLSELSLLDAHRCVFDHPGYERFVRALAQGGPRAADEEPDEPAAARAPLPRAAFFLRHKPQAWARRALRETGIFWGALHSRVDLIER